MLKIGESFEKRAPVFSLSGRIDRENLSELQALLDREAGVGGTTLDLAEVRLVDRDSVRFLASCEAKGIILRNCPFYIREWIESGGGTINERRCETIPEHDEL